MQQNVKFGNSRSRSTGYVHDLEMARNWELSGGLEWILRKGGASGCRFLVKEPRWQKTRLAPEIQEDQGGPIRGKGLRPNVCRDDNNSCPDVLGTKEGCYVCISALYSVTRNI